MPHGFNHDVISAHAGVKARINATTSFIANYDMPLKIHGIKQYEDFDVAKPTLQVGIELITTTHAFQIYVGNAHEILPQNSLMFQQNKFDLDGFRFGFVLTKL
jgi:stage III sporulation protein SpoIIIAA